MSLTAAVWPQFATQVFRGGIGRLTCIGSYVNKQVTTFTFPVQATTYVRNIILGQLWTQVASVHYEYGRLTLATAGLLFLGYWWAAFRAAVVAGAEPGPGDFEVTLSRGRGRHGARDCFGSLFCHLIMCCLLTALFFSIHAYKLYSEFDVSR